MCVFVKGGGGGGKHGGRGVFIIFFLAGILNCFTFVNVIILCFFICCNALGAVFDYTGQAHIYKLYYY